MLHICDAGLSKRTTVSHVGESGGDYLRKFINIFIWNWFFFQVSYRDVQYKIIENH